MISRLTAIIVLAVLLSGCAVSQEVFTGSADCGYIGCETGGLVIYPHE